MVKKTNTILLIVIGAVVIASLIFGGIFSVLEGRAERRGIVFRHFNRFYSGALGTLDVHTGNVASFHCYTISISNTQSNCDSIYTITKDGEELYRSPFLEGSKQIEYDDAYIILGQMRITNGGCKIISNEYRVRIPQDNFQVNLSYPDTIYLYEDKDGELIFINNFVEMNAKVTMVYTLESGLAGFNKFTQTVTDEFVLRVGETKRTIDIPESSANQKLSIKVDVALSVNVDKFTPENLNVVNENNDIVKAENVGVLPIDTITFSQPILVNYTYDTRELIETLNEINTTSEERALIISQLSLTNSEMAEIINSLEADNTEKAVIIEQLDTQEGNKAEIITELANQLSETQADRDFYKNELERMQRKSLTNNILIGVVILTLVGITAFALIRRKK